MRNHREAYLYSHAAKLLQWSIYSVRAQIIARIYLETISMLDEKNKNFALVTGASGGIGREIAKILLEKNYDLLLVARALEKLEAIRAEFNSVASKQTVTVLQADLSRKASSKMIFDFANNKNMTIEILVNNAGAGTSG